MNIIALYNAYIGRIVAALIGVIVISAFLYGGFLLGAVAHAAGRTQAEKEIRSLSAREGALESEYLSQTKTISPALAATMGFVAPASVVTVYANPAPGLTLR